MRGLLEFLTYSNVYLAIGGTCITLSSMIMLNTLINPIALFCCFSLVFFLYTLNRYTDIPEDKINYPERVYFFQRFGKILLIISGLLFVFSLYLVSLTNLYSLIILLLPIGLVLLYSVLRLKKYFLIKNIFVALGWSTIPIFIYSIFNFSLNFAAVLILFLFLFFRVLFGAIFFDIKDIAGDRIHKISTLPSIYGLKRTKIVLHILNIMASCLLIIGYIFNVFSVVAIFASLIGIYSFICIKLIGKINIKTLCEILVDGDGFVLLLLVLLGVSIW